MGPAWRVWRQGIVVERRLVRLEQKILYWETALKNERLTLTPCALVMQCSSSL